MTDDSFTVYIVCISPQMNKNSTAFTETVHTRKSNILPHFIYFFTAINSSQLCFDSSICFQRSHVIRHQFTRPPRLAHRCALCLICFVSPCLTTSCVPPWCRAGGPAPLLCCALKEETRRWIAALAAAHFIKGVSVGFKR